MLKGLCLSVLISILFGIIAGLFYLEINERKAEYQMITDLKKEVVSLKQTNNQLIKELIQVLAITQTFDTDAKFIESVEAYEGLAGIYNEK